LDIAARLLTGDPDVGLSFWKGTQKEMKRFAEYELLRRATRELLIAQMSRSFVFTPQCSLLRQPDAIVNSESPKPDPARFTPVNRNFILPRKQGEGL
jgi:hypothetical protein